MRRLISLLLAPAVLLGCDYSLPGPLQISSITIEPAEITVAQNQMLTITAIVRDALGNVVNEQPEWYVQDYFVAMPMSPMEPGKFRGSEIGTTFIEARLRGQ